MVKLQTDTQQLCPFTQFTDLKKKAISSKNDWADAAPLVIAPLWKDRPITAYNQQSAKNILLND